MIIAIIAKLAYIYTLLIVVYVILSWVPNKKGLLADIDNVLGRLCDPYLDLFKKFIPPIGGMIDISPIIAIVVLQIVVSLLQFIF